MASTLPRSLRRSCQQSLAIVFATTRLDNTPARRAITNLAAARTLDSIQRRPPQRLLHRQLDTAPAPTPTAPRPDVTRSVSVSTSNVGDAMIRENEPVGPDSLPTSRAEHGLCPSATHTSRHDRNQPAASATTHEKAARARTSRSPRKPFVRKNLTRALPDPVARLRDQVTHGRANDAWSTYAKWRREPAAMRSMPLTTMRKLAWLTARFARDSPLLLSAHEAMRRRQRLAEDMVAHKLDDESQQWTAADFCEVFMVLHKRHSVPQFPPTYRHVERLSRAAVARLWRRITTLPMVLLDPAPYNRFLLYHLEHGDSVAFQEVLNWMMQHSIHLHSFSYGQIIRMLLAQNQTETAAVMVKELVDAEYPPSSTMVCHLLHAFAMAGEQDTCDLIQTAWADRLTNASADDLVSLVDLLLPYPKMRAMTLDLASLALARIEQARNPKSAPQSHDDLRARTISSWLSRLIEDQSPMLVDFFRVLDTQSDRVRLDTWCRVTAAATAAAIPPPPRLSLDRPPSAPPPPPPPSPSRDPNHVYWRRGSWRHFARALALTPHVLDFETPQYFLAKLLGLMYAHGAGPEAVVLIRSLVVHAPRNATRTPVVNQALRILVAYNEHHLVQNVVWPRLRSSLETDPPHTVADTQTLNYLLISALNPRLAATAIAVGGSTATGQFANDVTETMTRAGVPGDAVTWSLVAKWALKNGAPGAVFAILDRAAEHRQGSASLLNMALKAATDAAHMQVIVEFLVAHGTESKVPAPKSSSRPRSGGPREWLLVDDENRFLFQDCVRELGCDVEEMRAAFGTALAEVLDDVEID